VFSHVYSQHTSTEILNSKEIEALILATPHVNGNKKVTTKDIEVASADLVFYKSAKKASAEK